MTSTGNLIIIIPSAVALAILSALGYRVYRDRRAERRSRD